MLLTEKAILKLARKNLEFICRMSTLETNPTTRLEWCLDDDLEFCCYFLNENQSIDQSRILFTTFIDDDKSFLFDFIATYNEEGQFVIVDEVYESDRDLLIERGVIGKDDNVIIHYNKLITYCYDFFYGPSVQGDYYMDLIKEQLEQR